MVSNKKTSWGVDQFICDAQRQACFVFWRSNATNPIDHAQSCLIHWCNVMLLHLHHAKPGDQMPFHELWQEFLAIVQGASWRQI